MTSIVTVTGAASWHIPISTILLTTFLSYLFHWILFFIIPISSFAPCHDDKKRKKHDARTRENVISTIHALITCTYVFIWISQYTMSLWDVNRTLAGGIWGTGDEWMYWIILYSIGYFIWDTHCMYQYDIGTPSSYLHHIIIGSAFFAGIMYRVGLPFHFFFLLEELSTPALNAKSLYKHRPQLAFYSSLTFAITFLLARLVYGSYVFAACLYTFGPYLKWTIDTHYMIGRNAVLFQFIVSSASRILNLYWGYAIVKKVLALTSTPSSSKTSTANTLTKDEPSTVIDKVVDEITHQHVNGHNGKRARSRKDD